MGKKKKHEEHANHERWLVSYADFITLLFAFFVTMYASSRVDGTKMGYVVDSIQRAFGTIPLSEISGGGRSIMPGANVPAQPSFVSDKGAGYEEAAMKETAEEIKKSLEAKGDGSEQSVGISLNERGMVISIADKVFFDIGQAAIREDVKPILDEIAQILLKTPNQIRIEGHTDNIPINTPQFPSNWELSTARATSIIRHFLTRYPFDPRKLSAAGYGEYRPIALNDNEDGRSKNRRVDIVILRSKTGQEEEPQ
ncbi:MAG: flagellar motor protein MotB [Thermodesulfobacteriota bacterium]